LVDRPILPITDIRIVGKRIKELLGLGGLRRKRGAAAGATGPAALQYPNCYEAVGIGRTEEEERGGGCEGRWERRPRGFTHGRQERRFFLLISCLIRLIHLSLYREEVLLDP
jgi:hypothetical protein